MLIPRRSLHARWLGALLALATFAVFGFAPAAEAQVKPRIVIGFDTSGSMGQTMNNIFTYGDGVGNTDCERGLDTDCNGKVDDARLYVAKEAVRNLILAFGDVDWALARFHQSQGTNITYPYSFNTDVSGKYAPWECGNAVSSFKNPQCYTGSIVDATQNPGMCSPMVTQRDRIPVACRPGSGANAHLRIPAGAGELKAINYSGDCPAMLDPVGDVLVGFPGFGAYTTKRNEPAILKWLDNVETNPVLTAITDGNFCNHDTTGNCELRAQGKTPLAGIITAMGDYLATTKASDPKGACRPYSILLITDGNETCSGDPVAAATSVSGNNILTYAVGLGLSNSEKTQINAIAHAGGTDAGATGGDYAYFADDPNTLAAGLSDIVRKSLLIEECNQADDDCDGNTDEGFTLYCNKPASHNAQDLCTDPGETVCNGIDDNCDGNIDEGLLNRCGTCGPEPIEICDGIDNDCDGVIDQGNTCNCFASSEICDNKDNDCDNKIDEGVTRPCSTDVGECTAGTEICTNGNWGVCSGTNPAAETCDNKDNDCDGVVDNFTRACGTNTGVCQPGVELCETGSWGTCIGAVPGGDEICDGLDNDCDTKIDEGNPDGGGACGVTGCAVGTYQCQNGSLKCVSNASGGSELCNGQDDDCDGMIDEGLNVGGACGKSTGDCSPGMIVCQNNAPVCVGAFGGGSEICDNVDNDCDTKVDEGIASGGACGTDEGACSAGHLACVGGDETCVGEKTPGRETCDCEDNDCDGDVDEKPDTGTLCPSGSSCVSCQCALPCQQLELGVACPEGKAAQTIGNKCYCVAANCTAKACAKETVDVEGDTKCEPGNPDLSNCVCKNNACTFPCEGVVCPSGLVCNPRDPEGRCEENNCRGLGCNTGFVCNAVTGECETDPCEDVECGDQACRLGTCEPSCANIECRSGERCAMGECVKDKCRGVSCASGQICDPANGECVANVCQTLHCPVEAVCDVSTGGCIVDPCTYLHCPGDQVCSDGECVAADKPMEDGGTGTDTPKRAPGKRVLAAGSGLTCAVRGVGHGPSGSGSGGPGPWVLLVSLVFWGVRRRAGRRQGQWSLLGVSLVALVVSVFASGCDVDPFCIDCGDGGVVGDGGRVPLDASTMGLEAGTKKDAGNGADSAVPPGTEICNATDDDKDGVVDEGFDFDTDTKNCGGCGKVCAPKHAFPMCDNGSCKIASCDVGWYDINKKASDGCEYRCLKTADDDSVCDQADNDCDKKVDEDVDFDNDVNNCGGCSRTCSFAHASSICDEGQCELVACDTNFYDIDNKAVTGCEYPCVPVGAEACNLMDDDCDGVVDNGNPGGGAACGESEGECNPGLLECRGGGLVCVGAQGRTFEVCDNKDNDCDSDIDEDTQFQTDINNCGSCGNVCDLDFAIPSCQGGACKIVACESGHLDDNGLAGDGCEFACSYRGPEICNGVDDDCDKSVDEGTTPPANFCNSNGECAGTTASCAGTLGWKCTYNDPDYENVEVSCDSKDNDCDGSVDEGFGVGSSCSNGEQGECRRGGQFVCNGGHDGVVCNAPTIGSGTPEECDGEDDDCDGSVDEGMDTDSVPAIPVTTAGGTVYVMQYEASRPDATSSAAGTIATHACARPNVLPWTNVTWDEAYDACCALNDSGTCSGSSGWQLCDASVWETACEAPSGMCTWGYEATCSSSQPTVCNGAEYDCDTGTPGIQDCIKTTGNAAFPACLADWGGSGEIYDLSGNVKEWTRTERGSALVHEIRGGSYNNVESGRSCAFDFTAADEIFKFPNTGFRCCYRP